MWQEYQYEEDGTNEHKGCEESQVTQSRSIQRYQTGEGTHRGNVAYQQWRHHLLQYFAYGVSMVGMCDEV